MRDHAAAVLVENLADGATAAELDAFEASCGYPLPSDLRTLWSIHAGQRSEQNGFIEAMDLYGPQEALSAGESVAMWIEAMREDPESYDEAGVDEAEIASDRWLAIAGRGYADLIVASGVSGRVFRCEKDVPPLHLLAPSIAAWLEAYAGDVDAGKYAVEEGFGDCYLERV